MQVKTLEAEGPILDYLVSVALGYELEAPDGLGRQLWMVKKADGQTTERQAFPIWPDDHTHRYSTDWELGGWLIEQKVTKVFRNIGGSWTAQIRHEKAHPLVNYPVLAGTTSSAGPTPLVAAMRCVARSELGEWVEVPDCLAPPPGAESPPASAPQQIADLQTRITQLEAELRNDHWPHGATVKLKWGGVANHGTTGWAKRDENGHLVSAYSHLPLDESQWEVVEERQAPPLAAEELDDDHPLACVNDQICGLLEGIGASEDHEGVVAFFLSTGLPRRTVDRIHRAIASAEVQPTEAGG